MHGPFLPDLYSNMEICEGHAAEYGTLDRLGYSRGRAHVCVGGRGFELTDVILAY